MEDDEDYEPTVEGFLERRYRGLTDVEPRVLSFSHRLLHLDVSFNQLQSVPTEIASLSLLQELNVSCNKLVTLPIEIGSLAWLRVIKANGNHITSIPCEISQCKCLQILILSENLLTSIPSGISECSSLQTLLLQNNSLSCLPLSLAALSGKLQKLDISNNNQQMAESVPTAIHRDPDSILWILANQQEKGKCIDTLNQDIKLLQHEYIATQHELSKAQEKISQLENRNNQLENDTEDVQMYLVARHHSREMRKRLIHFWTETKAAWQTRQLPTGRTR